MYRTSWITPASGFALDVAVWNSTRKMFSDIACVRFEIGSLCPLHVSPVMQSFSPACTVKSTALAASGSRIPRYPANAGLHETAGSSPQGHAGPRLRTIGRRRFAGRRTRSEEEPRGSLPTENTRATRALRIHQGRSAVAFLSVWIHSPEETTFRLT